jgi:hypothetical protein
MDAALSRVMALASPAHELILDLEPAVTTRDGRVYQATVVARGAGDGHWNAWLEFVAHASPDVLRTDIETHQASEADLHGWATTLSDVYLQGALDRAHVSSAETTAHRHAIEEAGQPAAPRALDPYAVFALGEHALRRELQLFRRARLLSLIIDCDLNPRGLDVSRFTKAQLVTFIVTAIEVRQSRAGRRDARPGPRSDHNTL